MQKIVAMLRVKDGKLFINDWLENIERLVDEIVAVDNGSTDGTYEILKAHPKVVEITQTEGFDEGRDKIMLYQMARKRKPDWCLWLDVDEIFEKAMTRDKIERIVSNNRINRYFFRRFHFVDNENFNADWKWIKYTAKFDRILWREQSTGYFEGIKFNSGLIKGISGRKKISHYRLKHLGYVNKKEVDKKIGIYRKVEPRLENTYQSMVFSNPRTIKWEEYYGLAKIKVFVLNLLLDIIFIFRFFYEKLKIGSKTIMIKKYWEYINTKGAIKAKANGIYLNTYKINLKIKQLGIYPNTFIDVGANRGMFTKTVNYVFPDCNIYSFEPIKACYSELKKLENTISTLKSFNCALSDYNGSAEFNESLYDYSSSLLKMTKRHESAFPYTKETTVYKVKVYPFEYFRNKIEFKAPTILKLDVQGAELKVIQGAGEMLKIVDYILCEMSFAILYDGQPLVKEVINYMFEKGFILIDILELNRDPINNELLQADGLFKRI